MPRKEGKKYLNVAMTESELQTVHSLAQRRGYKITADYIRDLIIQDARSHGEDMTFNVDRGGYRGGDKEESGN